MDRHPQGYYPFETLGYDNSNFIIDQDDWYMAAKISEDGLWRLKYGETPGLTAEYTKRLPARVKEMMPHFRAPPRSRSPTSVRTGCTRGWRRACGPGASY